MKKYTPEQIVSKLRQANASVETVGGPTAGSDDSVVGQGNDIDDCGADGVRPAGGQRNVRDRWVAQW